MCGSIVRLDAAGTETISRAMAHAIRSGKRGASTSGSEPDSGPDSQRRTAAKGRTFRQLRRNDLEAGDKLEVLHVERGQVEAEMQGRGPDGKVFEGDDYALRRLLAFDAAHHAGDFQRNRMHGNVAAQPVDEGQPSLLDRIVFCPIRAVHEFRDGHDREADVDLAVCGLYLLQDLEDGVASTLGGDNDARVEDQSHAGGFKACGCG